MTSARFLLFFQLLHQSGVSRFTLLVFSFTFYGLFEESEIYSWAKITHIKCPGDLKLYNLRSQKVLNKICEGSDVRLS